MESVEFNIGDPVWAKMKGFPPWPGLVKESPKSRPNFYWIFFFGTKNSGWVEAKCIKAYNENINHKFKKGCKTKAFEEACEEMEKYLVGGGIRSSAETEDAFDKLLKSTAPPDKPVKAIEATDNGETISSPSVDIPLNEKANENASKSIEEDDEGDDSAKDQNSKQNDHKRMARKKSSPFIANKKQRSLSITVADTTTPADSQNTTGNLSPSYIPDYQDLNSTPRLLNFTPPLSAAERPISPPLNIDNITKPSMKRITPSPLTFGFLGLGSIGTSFVKNMLLNEHKVVVWNRSPQKYAAVEELGAEVALTPSDVVSMADITFCCVSDAQVAKELVFGNCGVLSEMKPDKSYVEMSAIDPETSQYIGEAISSNGGRYLEARFEGTKTLAEEARINIMVSGDISVFSDCASVFSSCGNQVMYLGDVGNAPKMYLAYQTMLGITLEGFAEIMTLAERINIDQDMLLGILKESTLCCPLVIENCISMMNSDFNRGLPLKYLHKDLKLAHALADSLNLSVPALATTREAFMNAKRLGYGDQDASSVIVQTRH